MIATSDLEVVFFVREKEFLKHLRLTLAGKATNLLFTLISLKMTQLSEAKSAKRSFASNFQILDIFDAKLRFAFLASLLSAILSQIYVSNKMVILPARVKQAF